MRAAPAPPAGVLLLFGVVALAAVACGNGDQAAQLSGPVTHSGAAVAPTTAEPSPTTATGGAPPTASHGAADSTPTTTSKPAATSPPTTAPTTARAAPLAPAAPGTYRYTTAGQSTVGTNSTPYPAVTTLIVDPPVGNRQHGSRDLRDTAGNGPRLESTFEYRADGLYLVNLQAAITVLLLPVTESIQPVTPTLLLPTGVAPGYHRELDLPTATSTAHLVLDVVRQENVTVAGQTVGTTLVHLVASVPGQFNARLDLNIWLAPATGLWAREHLVGDANAGGIAYHTEYDATIQRLAPS